MTDRLIVRRGYIYMTTHFPVLMIQALQLKVAGLNKFYGDKKCVLIA